MSSERLAGIVRSERSFGDDSRGVSPLVGFILLLGILITAFAVYQVEFVPQQNAGVEFDHSQEITGDMEKLRAATLDVGAAETQSRDRTSVRLQLGMQYPTRLIALNPPPVEGRLQSESGTLRIENAEAVGEFAGSPNETLFDTDHETQRLRYEPNYAEYQGAPDAIHLEHSLLYNQQGETGTPIADQRLIGNGSINVVLLDGNIDEQHFRSTTVDIESIDGPTAEVPVTAAEGETFDVVLPTAEPDVWVDTLGSEFETGKSGVAAEATDTEEVTVTIADTGNWTVQMTKLGLNDRRASDTLSNIRSLDDEPAGPSVSLDSHEATVTAGDTVELSGEVSSLSDDRTRTETAIREVRLRVSGQGDEVFEFPENEDTTLTLEDEGVSVDTTGWTPGSYDVAVRASDERGLWTPWDDAENLRIVVEDEG